MKNLFWLVMANCLFCSCSYKIARIGYTENVNSLDTCSITITHTPSEIPAAATVQVGSITLQDGGFTNHCSEQEAMALLKKEACSVQASIILITTEKLPGWQSTCYQCTADFYKITQPALLKKEPGETKAPMPNRSNYTTSQTNPLVGILAYAIGFAAGYTIMSIILKH